jgi:hypothetical protein
MKKPDPLDRLISIVGPNFAAGLITNRGVVVRAAPILRYMIGWRIDHVLEYARSRGWVVSRPP